MVTEAAPTRSSPLDPGMEALYRELSEPFYRYARSRDLSEYDAWDVVQKVMVGLLEDWPRVSAKAPEERVRYAWGALRNAITDVWRRQKHDTDLGERIQQAQPAAGHGDPASRDPAGAEALRLIRTLTRCQYQVMVLACEGLKPRQIAAELGMPPSTVRSHLCDARRTLTKKLQPWKDSGRED